MQKKMAVSRDDYEQQQDLLREITHNAKERKCSVKSRYGRMLVCNSAALVYYSCTVLSLLLMRVLKWTSSLQMVSISILQLSLYVLLYCDSHPAPRV